MIRKRNAEQEQRTLIAVVLTIGIYLVWTTLYAPVPAPSPATSPTPAEPVAVQDAPVAPTTPAAASVPSDLPEVEAPLRTSELTGSISSQGGALRGVVLENHRAPFEVTPIWRHAIALVTGDAEAWLPYGVEPGQEHLLTESGRFLLAGAGAVSELPSAVEGDGPWTTRGTTPEGVTVTKSWRTTEDPDLLEVDITFQNGGSAPFTGPLWIGALDAFSGDAGRYDNVSRPFGYVDGDLEQLMELDDTDEGPEVFEGEVEWLAIADRYFMLAAAPLGESWGQLDFRAVDTERHGVFLTREVTLAPGAAESVSFEVYGGPRDLERLGAIGHSLDEAVDLGFFGFFARILLLILQFFQSFVGNWGVAIIALTFSVKLAFWPLTKKSYESGRKMQALSPKIQKLREKHKDDPQRAGQEQMKLFQEEGVNPMGGCLPMVVQMPVWFALYSVLLYAGDVYHAEFLYLKDLSAIDPYGALPTLVGVMMILQQTLTPMSPGMDPTQQKMMRLMPLIFVVIMYAFPSGLALYVFVNTSLSILQMWLVRRAIPAPAAA